MNRSGSRLFGAIFKESNAATIQLLVVPDIDQFAL
jgi:hypothetical protein